MIISGACSQQGFESSDDIVTVLRKFWETDSIGIKDERDIDEKPKAITSDTVKPVFKENHYEVGLPWKEDYAPSSTIDYAKRC